MKTLLLLLAISATSAQAPAPDTNSPEALDSLKTLMLSMEDPGCKTKPVGFCSMFWMGMGISPFGQRMYTVYIPTGPCGTISRVSPTEIGVTTGEEDDKTVWVFTEWPKASEALWAFCTQKRADILAAHGMH